MPIYGFDETKSKFPVLDKSTYDPAGKAGQIVIVPDIKPIILSDDITANPAIPAFYVMTADSKTITLGTNVTAGVMATIYAKNAVNLTFDANGGTVTDKLAAGEIRRLMFTGTYWDIEDDKDHNIPRIEPKDITAYFTDGSLWKRIHGTDGYKKFQDIYVGDYFDMGTTVRASGSTTNLGTSWITVAGINTMMKRGYNSAAITTDYVNYDHLVMIAGKGKTALCFGDGQMYASIPFTGGYNGSKMKTTILTNIDSQLNAIFSTHLKSTWELLSNANNLTAWAKYGSAAGASTSWTWTQVKSVLLSEIEAYGSVSFGSTGFDIGSAMTQLPLFRHWPEALWVRDTQTSWWLKDVVTGAMFADVGWGGTADIYAATDVIGVRPRFLIS